MLSDTVEYLKDSRLVAQIQEYFGVKIHYDGTESKNASFDQRRIKGNITSENSLGTFSNLDNLEENHKLKKRKDGDETSDDDVNTTAPEDPPHFTITNYIWYYLFLFGTELGDEIFYSMFIPFWFWNIDGAVGRRVVLVWAIVMSIGQCLKDIICWPRPDCPPAARLQKKWSQEYGMPSTHAMIAVSIPFSVLFFTTNRYIYSLPIGLTIAVLWCSLVCMSRLYLGMHTVFDVLVGLALAILLMIILVPLVDVTDYYFVTKDWALALLVAIGIATVVYYPCSDKWTPTRGDTTMVVSVTTGVHVGAWLNYKTGAMSTPPISPPYYIIWPSYPMLGRTVLRTILGFCCVIATRALFKFLSYATMCAILRVNSKELMKSQNCLENRNKVLVDLVYKYITCFMIGWNTVYLLPNVFTMIGIERPMFYTEI